MLLTSNTNRTLRNLQGYSLPSSVARISTFWGTVVFLILFGAHHGLSQYHILEKRHHELRLPSERNTLEDSLLPMLPHVQDTTKVAMLNALSWSYRGANFLLAMKYAQEGAQIAANLGYTRVRAENCNFIGIIYRNVGDYEKAMAYFQEARAIAEKQNYKIELGYALNNIGDVYKYLGNYSLARDYVQRALNIFTELNHSSGLNYGYFRMAEIAQLEKKFLSAVSFFELSRRYDISKDNPAWRAGNFLSTGQAYLAANEYSSALQAFFDADNSLADSLSYNEDILTISYIQKGKAYRGLHNLDSALFCLEEGLRRSQSRQMQTNIREAAKELAYVYSDIGDYRKVSYFQAIQMTAADSLLHQSEQQEIERLGAKYELAKQQADLDSLRTVQDRQQTIGIALILGIILLILIALLLLRNIRSERLANAEIMRQQSILEHQSLEIEMNNTMLLERNSLLSILTQEKTDLMEIVSHDLKNPISAVRGLAELIRYNFVEEEKISQTAEQIIQTSNKMFQLVTNVLDLNRLEEGRQQFNLIEFDITSLVEFCVEQYRQQAAAKNITIYYQNTSEGLHVLADEQACIQILDNLLSNAVKYSQHGTQMSVRIASSFVVNDSNREKNVQYLRIEVQNEGEGISAQDMQKLFGKFARLSARPTGGEHSTGLGLSIVKKMVEAMNGRVWCESELGKGATFIVELPLSVPA
ncbi:MAG: hypothetical protein EAZ92_11050 [Candidatus Kapaibacterium sp.]|nr:MAG: hypothetical protein EAZ92_11050 [Candidatus Kapabacteria bacterium]